MFVLPSHTPLPLCLQRRTLNLPLSPQPQLEASPRAVDGNLAIAPPTPHMTTLTLDTYDASTVRPRFSQLALGTDLNQPPLPSASAPSHHHASDQLTVDGHGWEPYRLFPVERPAAFPTPPPNVITSAENLKALFTMPYTSDPVRAACSRVTPY